ncbi:hypothetical protein HJFPF1_07438 [Paramyrothecium foliicola]|nr:hypothetical protein HJFPF1_07438 [Paramyrothecium foliicola]
MTFIKLLPLAGVALAAVDGKSLTKLDGSESLYGVSADSLIERLENANATASGTSWFSDNFRANESDALSWRGSIRLSVAAHVPVPKMGENQVAQLSAFSITPHNQTTADNFPADVCVTLIQGLNDELTEQSQELEDNSCGMIPDDCGDEFRELAMENVDYNGCTNNFSLPPACEKAFPNGAVSSFKMLIAVQTDRLAEGGYIFVHASSPAQSGSDKAANAYAKTLKSIWPVFIANMENLKGNLGVPARQGSFRCLRAHQFLGGSIDPNEEQESANNNEANEDDNTPGSGAGRLETLGLSGLLMAITAAVTLF